MFKRIFDILIAFCGLVVCAPLFLGIAVLIKLTSPGPIFFRQTRMGKGFRRFSIYKFRTMRWDPAANGMSITVGDDSRITPVGQWLRQCKLDELPQLMNVLKGEMSLVGPRPEVPQYVEMYKEKYDGVLTVLPGMTDLASLQFIDESVKLSRSDKPEEDYVQNVLPEKIRLANVYIQHAGVIFDLLIIIQTLCKLMHIEVRLIKFSDSQSARKTSTGGTDSAVNRMILKYRRLIIVTLDLCLIVIANYLAFWLRFDGTIPEQAWTYFLQTLPWLLVIRGVVFMVFRINEGLWRYVSLWDLRNILSSVVISTIVFYAVVRWGIVLQGYPRSIYVIDMMLLVGFLIGIRLPFRLYREVRSSRHKKKVLIIGAGDTGEGIARQMKADASHDWEPIGFIDDDPSMANQRIHGIKVLGARKDIPGIIVTHKPHEVLVAIPENKPAVIREILTSLESFKVPIKRLPNLHEFLEGKFTISQMRHLAIEDLLERPPIGLQAQGLQDLISGKRVLVTGAGGSIGSELCRQIAALNPQGLILYERYENSMYTIMNELGDRKYPFLLESIIGDVTDSARVMSTLKEYRPHIIFHAAAHKHVPLMELNPGEAMKNNVWGSRTMAKAAEQCGVELFVLISTDKAVNPTSVMGATKRVAELLIQDLAHRSQTCYLTVRFGNVLGSNGSVVPRFQEQIKAGGPVTVTHPDVRRYFMLISEAVHLVLQAATLGERGMTYVLDMGEQIKLVDLAHNLIRLSGYIPEQDIPITFVGLRPGEKIEEELVGDGETVEPSSIAKIQRLKINKPHDMTSFTLVWKLLEESIAINNPSKVIGQLQQILPNFKPVDTTKPSSTLHYKVMLAPTVQKTVRNERMGRIPATRISVIKSFLLLSTDSLISEGYSRSRTRLPVRIVIFRCVSDVVRLEERWFKNLNNGISGCAARKWQSGDLYRVRL